MGPHCCLIPSTWVAAKSFVDFWPTWREGPNRWCQLIKAWSIALEEEQKSKSNIEFWSLTTDCATAWSERLGSSQTESSTTTPWIGESHDSRLLLLRILSNQADKATIWQVQAKEADKYYRSGHLKLQYTTWWTRLMLIYSGSQKTCISLSLSKLMKTNVSSNTN